jgi:hypothetical protein
MICYSNAQISRPVSGREQRFCRAVDAGRRRSGRLIRTGHRQAMRIAALGLVVVLAAGCALNARLQPSSDVAATVPAPSGVIRRCSPSDPDRGVWFCVIGQTVYNIVAAITLNGGWNFR